MFSFTDLLFLPRCPITSSKKAFLLRKEVALVSRKLSLTVRLTSARLLLSLKSIPYSGLLPTSVKAFCKSFALMLPSWTRCSSIWTDAIDPPLEKMVFSAEPFVTRIWIVPSPPFLISCSLASLIFFTRMSAVLLSALAHTSPVARTNLIPPSAFRIFLSPAIKSPTNILSGLMMTVGLPPIVLRSKSLVRSPSSMCFW